MQTGTHTTRNPLPRFAFTLGLVWLSAFCAGAAEAAKQGNSGQATYVGGVTYSVSPFHPAPGDPFNLTVTFHGAGHGQPCDISNIQATIQGVTLPGQPFDGYTHPPSQSTLTSKFRFSGFESGSLVPTIDYDTLRRNAKTPCEGDSSAPVTPEGNTDPPSVKPNPEPALGITKALSGNTTDFVPGEVVTYQIVVENAGEGDATNATVSDQLSPHLLFVSAPGATSTPAVGSSGTVQWTLASLTSQDSHEFSVTARVADSAPEGALSNTAHVTAGSQNKTSNSPNITIHRDPDVTLRKTINGPLETGVRVAAGSVVTYQLHYENVGSGDASNVVITDTIPPEIIGTPSLQGGDTQSWNPTTRVATWNINTLTAGAGSVVTASGQIDPALAGSNFDNQASVTWVGGAGNSNVANVAVLPEPEFRFEKSADQDNAAAGDRLHFSIAYENTGTAAATGAQIVDYLPATMTPVAGSYGSAVYSTTDNTLTWSLGRVEPGEAGSVSYAVTVDTNARAGEAVNIATLTATNLPSPVQGSEQTTINEAGVVELVVSKALADPDEDHVIDGSEVTYQIVVENRGNRDTAGGVTLIDTLPPHLVYANTSQSWTASQDQDVVSRTIADIPAGGTSGTYLLTLRVDGTGLPDGAVIDNQVEATNTTAGIDYNDISPPARVYYNLPPSVTLTKVASPAPSVPVSTGDVIDYTLTARLDTAQGVTDLQVGDVLPLGLTFESSVDGGYTLETLDDGRQLVRWPVIALDAGERSYQLRARVDAGLPLGTALENIGLAAYNNELAQSAVTHHTAAAAISITKSRPETQAQIAPGEVLRFEITYTNTGKVPLTGITVTDSLPTNTSLDAASPPPTTIGNDGSTLVWQLPGLNPGRSNTLTLSVNTDSVQSGDTLTNQAAVSTAEAPQQTASAVSHVRQTGELVVEKTVHPEIAYPGDTVTFTLEYANKGKGDALNTVLGDQLPAELDFVSASDQLSPDANGLVQWSLGTLKAGASGTKLITMKVPENGQFVPAVEVDNFVTLVSDNDADSDTATVTLTEKPSFTIEEHEGTLAPTAVGIASPGDTLHYLVDVEKTGGAATGVLLAELLPDRTTYVPGSANYPIDTARSDLAAGLLVWDVGSLNAGVIPGQITFDAVIDADVVDGTRLTARAGVASNETGSLLSNEVVTEISANLAFSLIKSASKQTLFSPTSVSGAAPDTVTYYLTAENNGNAMATDVTVSDTLPAQLVIDPASTTGTVSGQTITWSLPILEPGVPITLSVSAIVATDVLEGTLLTNSANLTTAMPGVGGAISNEVEIRVTGEAVLSMTKSASTQSVSPGDEFSYTISYQNTGTQASDTLRIEDTLPDHVTFVSATQGGAPDAQQPGTIVWNNLPGLAPGTTDSVQVLVRVDAVVADGTALPNTAMLSPTTNPTDSIPSTFEGKPPVVSSGPLLQLTKQSVTGDAVAAGDVAIFSIEVANIGSDNATNLTLTDTLPPGMTLVDASGNYSVQGNVISWSAPVLPAKQSAVLQLTGRVAANLENGEVLTNRSSLTAAELPLPLTDEAEIVVRNATLIMSKTADRDFANSGISAANEAGDEIVYRLEYENTGSVEAASAQIVDVLPPEVSFIESLPEPDAINGQTLSWELGAVPAGTNGAILIKTQVVDELREGTVIHNSASITSTTTGTNQSNGTDVTVLSGAVLSVEKSTTIATIGSGDTVTYDITVRNEGSDDAVNVQVTDTLAGTVSFVSATGGGVHSGEVTGGTVVWTLPNLAPGGEVVYHVSVQAVDDLSDGDAVLNSVTVSGEKPGNGGPLPQITDSMTIPVTGQPALELDYQVNRKTVPVGSQLLYTITTHNIGNADAIDAVLTATVPDGTEAATIDAGGRFEDGKAVWSTSTLPPSGPITLTFAVNTLTSLLPGMQLVSKANIVADNAAPKSAAVITLVLGEPDLEIRKVGASFIVAGEELQYSITVSNVGGAVAPDVVLTDLLPEGTAFKSATPPPDAIAGKGLVWKLGNITPGSIQGIVLTVSTDATSLPQTLNNFVQVADSLRQVEVDEWQTVEGASGSLGVAIVPDQPTHSPGSKVVFSLDWRNTGSFVTTGTVVRAAVPSDVTYTSATGGGQLNNGWVEWQIGDLSAGAEGQATFTVDISPTAASGTRLDSTAEIRANLVTPDSDNASVNVVDVPILLLAKSVSSERATLGDTLTFTLSYRNGGEAALTGVTLVDTLPDGLQATAVSAGGVLSEDGSTVTWALPDIEPGSDGAVTVDTKITGIVAASVTNVATLISTELPDEQASVTVNTSRPIVPVPIDARWLIVLFGLMVALVMGRRCLGLVTP